MIYNNRILFLAQLLASCKSAETHCHFIFIHRQRFMESPSPGPLPITMAEKEKPSGSYSGCEMIILEMTGITAVHNSLTILGCKEGAGFSILQWTQNNGVTENWNNWQKWLLSTIPFSPHFKPQ